LKAVEAAVILNSDSLTVTFVAAAFGVVVVLACVVVLAEETVMFCLMPAASGPGPVRTPGAWGPKPPIPSCTIVPLVIASSWTWLPHP